MMENKLFEIRVLYLDKNGSELKVFRKDLAHFVRLSLLFDSNTCHVQLPANADIREVESGLNDILTRLRAL